MDLWIGTFWPFFWEKRALWPHHWRKWNRCSDKRSIWSSQVDNCSIFLWEDLCAELCRCLYCLVSFLWESYTVGSLYITHRCTPSPNRHCRWQRCPKWQWQSGTAEPAHWRADRWCVIPGLGFQASGIAAFCRFGAQTPSDDCGPEEIPSHSTGHRRNQVRWKLLLRLVISCSWHNTFTCSLMF